ncbi:MAG: hypothetical protein EBQ95_07600 [Gammaproteobacteria bacterium]|nr:hypothetical protein [Gammaproteobacteria bacterium]
MLKNHGIFLKKNIRRRTNSYQNAADSFMGCFSQNYETNTIYGFSHPLVYDNVIKSLSGTETPFVDGQEELASLE